MPAQLNTKTGKTDFLGQGVKNLGPRIAYKRFCCEEWHLRRGYFAPDTVDNSSRATPSFRCPQCPTDSGISVADSNCRHRRIIIVVDQSMAQ
jgi:hypothetical protein